MDIKVNIGNRIKALREEANITQKDLSFSSDLDRSYIAGVESGKRNISIKNIERIAKALNISVKDFFDSNEFN